ncbi:MAG: mandelate racemase/muconate lactonizing enzyme family protein [Deltaproteobacteria bacterium]|nr:mandelate racemase/muconate lactonizing enzyme family protein [Deltaproteobacteria bacterium]
MSKVERIELYHVNVPLDEPFYPSWIPGYPQTHVRFTVIRVTSDDGISGVSAGTAFSKERAGLGDLIGGFLIGVQADDLVTVRKRLREASYLGWRNWWIEGAFWDLLGKLKGKPVYKLLQDKEETVRQAKIYASSGEVRTIADRRPYLNDIRDKGIQAVKIRVKDPARRDDVTILKEVRKELGDDFIIGVDANQGWPVSLFDETPIWDLEYATEFGKACDDLGLAWIEEPLDMHDFDGMAALRKRIKTPIAGGELHGDWHEIRALFDHECLDKYQPDATFCGGLTVAKQVMAECRLRKLKYSPHTWTCGIGLLVNLHAFAAWENRELLEYPYEPPGWVPAKREGIIPPIEVNPDGTLDVPQESGLGIHINERLLRKYGKRFYLATPLRIAVKTIREKGLKTALELKRKKS